MKSLESWKVLDDFGVRVKPLIPERPRDADKIYKRKLGGVKKPQEPRKVFEGSLYVLRAGCQWQAIPKSDYGSGSPIPLYYLDWQAAGLFDQLGCASLLAMMNWKGLPGSTQRA